MMPIKMQGVARFQHSPREQAQCNAVCNNTTRITKGISSLTQQARINESIHCFDQDLFVSPFFSGSVPFLDQLFVSPFFSGSAPF
jgi:hypothetical protein